MNISILNSLISKFYWFIFKEDISLEEQKIFNNILLLGTGTIISIFLLFPYNILTVRILGPTEYGKFTIIQSSSMLLYIPMCICIYVAITKYISEQKGKEEISVIISTGYLLIGIFLILATFIYFLFYQNLSNILSLSGEALFYSIILAILFVLYTVTTSTLKGLFLMRYLSVFQPIYGFILITVFGSIVLLGNTTYLSMFFALASGYFIIGIVIILLKIKDYLHFNFNIVIAKKLLHYSVFTVIAGISFSIYTNIDKILINKFLSVTDAGIYSAYYYAAFTAPMVFYGVFNTILFVYSSKYKQKRVILSKIDKLIPFLICCGIPMSFFAEFLILNLYGSEYPIDIYLMILFSVSCVLVIWYGLNDWVVSSEGISGIKLTSISAISIAVSNLILNYFLIQKIGLFGGVISSILSFLIGLGFIYYLRRKIP
jgi:O-antigen/teichoic acid export membrane protein